MAFSFVYNKFPLILSDGDAVLSRKFPIEVGVFFLGGVVAKQGGGYGYSVEVVGVPGGVVAVLFFVIFDACNFAECGHKVVKCT